MSCAVGCGVVQGAVAGGGEEEGCWALRSLGGIGVLGGGEGVWRDWWHGWVAVLDVERSPLALGKFDGRGSAAGVEGAPRA